MAIKRKVLFFFSFKLKLKIFSVDDDATNAQTSAESSDDNDCDNEGLKLDFWLELIIFLDLAVTYKLTKVSKTGRQKPTLHFDRISGSSITKAEYVVERYYKEHWYLMCSGRRFKGKKEQTVACKAHISI